MDNYRYIIIDSKDNCATTFEEISQKSRIKKAQADYERSLYDLKEAEKEIALDAHQTYFNYQEAVIRIQNSSERIKLAQQRLSSSQYQMGLRQIPLSSVIDAKIKLADEQALYIQALADYKISLYKLDKAVGKLGEFSNKGGKI